MDYAELRKKMVEEQLIARGIKDRRVLGAFRKVERHKFVPEDAASSAYADFPLPIGAGQTISQPYIVALMTECLDLKGEERVLEIGTGSGYQTAILAELALKVYSIERLEALSGKATNMLAELGYSNIELKTGDGTSGWQEFAPFDRILVAACADKVPLPLIEQLSEGGKLIAPLGRAGGQILTLIEKKNNQLASTDICGCVFVPLLGKYA